MPPRACRCAVLAASAITAASLALPGIAGAALPEGRAYEMVSSPDKNGGAVARVATIQAGVTGNAIVYGSSGIFADPVGSSFYSYYVSQRDGSGWRTANVEAPQHNPGDLLTTTTYASDEDARSVFQFSLKAAAPGAVDGRTNLYLRDNRTGVRRLLQTLPQEAFRSFVGFGADPFRAGTPDLSHVVFDSNVKLTPDALDGQDNVYEIADGQLRLVSKDRTGTAVPARVEMYSRGSRAMSADGSKLAWLGNAFGSGPLYLRVEGQEQPVLVSGSQRAGDDPEVPQDADEFGGMSRDGSVLYFTSTTNLTDESDTRVTPSLYRYETATGTLTDLTPTPPAATIGTGVRRILAVSDDGRTVYFAARGALTPDAVEQDFFQSNYYVWRDGTIKLIGATGGPTPDYTEQTPASWYASANGRYFAFTSAQPFTGGNMTNPAACEASFGSPDGACQQVFVYDAQTDELACASCNGSTAPLGHSELGGGSIRPSTLNAAYARAVLDDGSVFFDSPNRLARDDVNGTKDVYRWRGGKVHLMSTGRSEDPSVFGDASPNGRDVFIITSERLVGIDVDDSFDLYDARVGGGIPAQNPPTPPAPCAGEGCLGPPTPRPADIAPGTQHTSPETEEPPAAKVDVLSVSRTQLARAARTGRLVVRVRPNRKGKVNVKATARIGRRTRTVATASRTLSRATTASVTLKLSTTARRQLRRGRTLRVSLAVALSGTDARDTARVTLRRKAAKR